MRSIAISLLLAVCAPAHGSGGGFDWEEHFVAECPLWGLSTASELLDSYLAVLPEAEREAALRLGTPQARLVSLPGPGTELPGGGLLVLADQRAWWSLTPLEDWPAREGLRGHLVEAREDVAQLERMTGVDQAQRGGLLLAVDRDSSAREVARALEAATEEGLSWIAIVGPAEEQPELPPLPDPAFAGELRSQAEELGGGEERRKLLLSWNTAYLGQCMGAAAAFSSLGELHPAQLRQLGCERVHQLLAEELRQCPLLGEAELRRLATSYRMLSGDGPKLWLTSLRVELDAEAPPLVVEGDMPWSALAAVLVARQGHALRLAVE